MPFDTQPPLGLLDCSVRRGRVVVGPQPAGKTEERTRGEVREDLFYYWGRPLHRSAIAYRRARRWLDIGEIIGGLIFTFGFFGLFFFIVSERGLTDALFTAEFWVAGSLVAFLFWLGVASASFVCYRAMYIDRAPELVQFKRRGDQSALPVRELLIDSASLTTLSRNQAKDIAATFTDEAHRALEHAYAVADRHGDREILPTHLFYALLGTSQARSIFLRLGVPAAAIQAQCATFMASVQNAVIPTLSEDAYAILFYAYRHAAERRQEYVHVTELLLATVRQSPAIQEFLYDNNIDAEKLTSVIEWMRVRERLRRQYMAMKRAGAHRSKYGIDRAMTAVATPYLNSFSQDMTIQAKMGYLDACVARDTEMEEVFRMIDSGANSMLLVGASGVGKVSLVEGIAQKMVEEDVPTRLHDKRLVQLSVSSLLAGTTVSGAQERLIHIMNEVARAKNIVLFINNIHDLMGGGEGKAEGLDVSGTLAELMRDGDAVIISTTTPEGYNRHILNTELGSTVAKVAMEEMSESQAIQVLESKAGMVEYKQSVFFSYDAIATAVKLAKQFLHDQRLPENAIALMTEAASFARSKKGEHALVVPDDIAALVAQKTGVPVTTMTQNESDKLLRLEEEMHTRVIGQHDAVVLVANALRRARADIRSKNRPISTFLFLGPTGVGKTELAKTIADVYFGGEQRMIRLDMSEFQDRTGVYRLIGQPGEQGTGMLTEAVRQHPFSLVLLDELEKADKDILNVFLQVFDDGRLTDSVGRVIDFTNTIIIATSNAGTDYASRELSAGKPLEDVRQALIRDELKPYYRPEFLNRFDGIVLFKNLNREETKHIAELMLKRVAKDLEARGVFLRVDAAALDALADVGFDPQFGARPMRRAIQDHVENKLAEMVLSKQLNRRDTVVIGAGMDMWVEERK